jgi:hypothetical protein
MRNTVTIGELAISVKRRSGCKLVLGASRMIQGRVLTPLLMKKEKMGYVKGRGDLTRPKWRKY